MLRVRDYVEAKSASGVICDDVIRPKERKDLKVAVYEVTGS